MENTEKKSYLGFIIWNILLVLYFGIIVMSMTESHIIVAIFGVLPALIFAIFAKKSPKQMCNFSMIYGFIILILLIAMLFSLVYGVHHGLYIFLAVLFIPYSIGSVVLLLAKIFSKNK